MIVIPDVSKEEVLRYVLGLVSPDIAVSYHWFVNNLTPDDDTVVGDFTEAGGGSIAALDVSSGDWTVSASAHMGIAAAPEVTLSVTAPVTLYGYYVTPADDATVLLWCERFESGPFVYSSDGTLLFTPRLTCFTCAAVQSFVYSTQGNYEFPVPPGVSKLTSTAWGGGGCGGLSGSELIGGGGGSGGAIAGVMDVTVTPGDSVNLTVGDPGTGGGDGGNSTVTVASTLLVEAVGGNGGTGSLAGPKALAADCTGDWAYDSGEGGNGDGAASGGGGASGGTLGSGGDGLDGAFGGAGGSPAGVGGQGGQGGGLSSDGFAGIAPGGGGGGGGGGERSYAVGAPGRIILVWS